MPQALNLAADCQRDGKLAEAEAACREILRSRPGHFDASHLLAIVCHQQGRTAEAVDVLQASLGDNPVAADALCNHGFMLQQLGRHAEALASYDRALAVRPRDAEAHCSRAAALNALQRHAEALVSSDRALALRPRLAEALYNRGLACSALARHAEALASYDRALTIKPDYREAHNNRGVALNALDHHADAIASYDKALVLQPNYSCALYNRGRALDELHRYEEALASYDRVLAVEPDHYEAHNNRGAALDAIGRHEEALDSFAKALAIRPGYAEALNNRGTALAELGRPDEALDSYDAALAFDPDYVEGRWNRALVHLRQGDLARGWQGYEWRRRRSWEPRNLPGPEWDGRVVPGQRLLLYAEQGLGDTIQFARFVRAIAAAGTEVVVEVQAPLATLMQSLAGVAVIGKGAPLPAFDCHLPLMSLPHVLGITSVPAEQPYLAAHAVRVERWSQALPRGSFRVGIAWQGNPRAPGDRGRSIPLSEFQPLARVPGVRLVSLQKNDGIGQLSDLPAGMAVDRLGDDFDSGADAFVDTAAVMMNLDLVITSDTSIAHLAGALGRPVWVALKHVPDWRFMTEREDWPWYPTARLFRQSRRGEWGDVFARMATELTSVTAKARAGDLVAPPAVPLAPISIGELIDKMTILEIKSERIDDPQKSANIRLELDLLTASRAWAAPTAAAAQLKGELKCVNELLWEIEDLIRAFERAQDFGPDFVALARSVYKTNDRRSAIKRRINELSDSSIVEEKSYSRYSAPE